MSWLHERRTLQSEQNGEITCQRWFGRWDVRVGGLEQTSPFVIGLWRKSLKKLPRERKFKRVLMLGLGAGGVIRLLQRRFPKAAIVAVEWDPEMAKLPKELGFVSSFSNVEIIVGDAREAVQKIQGKFDFIICDLFVGQKLSSVYEDDSFIRRLRELTDNDGWMLVNGYNNPRIFSYCKESFFELKRFKIITNWFAIFRPPHAGSVGEAPNAEYHRTWLSKKFLDRDFEGRHGFEIVARGQAVGLRQRFGSVVLDTFRGTEEPLDDGTTTGFALWQPIERVTASKGWLPIPLFFDRRRTGYLRLPDDADMHRWSESTRRKLKQAGAKIVEISSDVYLDALREADLPTSLIAVFSKDVTNKSLRHSSLLHCLAAVDESGHVIAGLAVLDVPEISSSLHVSAFMAKQTTDSSAGVALIAAWMGKTSEKGLTFMDFDALWRPGEDRDWRGFSRFKEQFGLRKIDYCWPRIKLMRRKERVT